jgi:hypothetical protein
MLQTVFLVSQHLKNSAISAREVWAKERNTYFLERVVSRWSDEEFKDNFRVSRETFAYLCSELKPRLQRRYFVRKPLSVEQRVAITLWRLGTNNEYRSIGHLFGVGLSSVHVGVKEVCNMPSWTSYCLVMSRYYLVIVSRKLYVDGFECKWGFPQCIGAIDGTHIPIIAPKENALDYFNRKGHHSVVMQALVSCDYTFMDIYIGWPGSVHDARVLTNSKLFQEAEAGSLLPNTTRDINGINIPLLILGDPAYPILPWLMKPYSDNGRLTAKQFRFNYRLSRARMVVECAFGRLKGRLRSLLKCNDTDIKFLPTYIAACCVLHNICEIHKDTFNDEWITQQNDENSVQTAHTTSNTQSTGPSNSTVMANAIREALSDYFTS